MNENKVSGGSYGAIIGVSDIEKARSSLFRYPWVMMKWFMIQLISFPICINLPGGNKECRRVLLKSSEPFKGPFNRIFGQSVIELIKIN